MEDSASPMPDPLDLYRLAVQHPLAEVAFIEHCWSHYHGDAAEPMLMREDFAGTCAVAAAWVASDPDRQAMAIEWDEPTAQWAASRFEDPDLHIVAADVMTIDEPAVDVTLALNFSVLYHHERDSLVAYMTHCRRGLNPGGLLIVDVFGGPGVDRPSLDRRRIEPDEGGVESFDYEWEQHGLDRSTGRIDCRIHFDLGGEDRLQDAFVYDWRLWSPQELIEAAREAGFAEASLWWADPGQSGRSEPIKGVPEGQDWVGYVVCREPGELSGV